MSSITDSNEKQFFKLGGIFANQEMHRLVSEKAHPDELRMLSEGQSVFTYEVKIVIDGKAGAGKSTVGQRLAKYFGLVQIDTGYIFKALAKQLSSDIIDKPEKNLDVIREKMERLCLVHIADTELDEAIYSKLASRIASSSAIRSSFDAKTRDLVNQFHSIVTTGRDTGINALGAAVGVHRVFLAVSDDIAKQRKGLQYGSKNEERETASRNKTDQSRTISHKDALCIDTDNKTIDQVFLEIAQPFL